ncbi:MAG: sigma-70 family RNA polymerase sigma factor [Planctomycetes bacterium]|nr:sigma-70 family RNA polymerase sigma factor [Planctomycetota bacterium]
MTSRDLVADSLLVHASFVQRLARGLAGPDGDDLAQDTWAAALQAEGARGTEVQSARGWLATITANLWRNATRAAVRRERREALATVARSEPSVAEILEREEVRRHVVEAVVGLPERLRSVVLLRFFEGLDSATIAARLGLPASTVRAQLQQALSVLRQRLDKTHGERRDAWALPLLGWCGTSPAQLAGTLLRITWPVRAAMGAVALLLLAWLTLPFWGGPPTAPPVVPIGTVEVVALEPDPNEVERSSADPQREIVANVIAAKAKGPEDLWGRVVAAADGAPIVGAEVLLEHRDSDEMTSLDLEYKKRSEVVGTARTDADGAFAFPVRRALQHRLIVRAAGFATLREQHCTGGSEFVLRLERPAFVEGVVRRKDGTPLGDVPLAAFERGGTGDRTVTRTAADGTFFLGGLAPKPTYIEVRPAGLRAPGWKRVDLEAGKGQRVEIEVEAGRVVRGVVRDADSGQPVAGARVDTNWTMRDAVSTADDGTFELRGLGARETLRVQARGYAEQAHVLGAGSEDLRVDIALSAGAVVLGRIVDSAGLPVRDCYVAACVDQMLSSGSAVTFWSGGSVASDGRFRIEGLAVGPDRGDGVHVFLPWQLLVRAPGMGTRAVALPATVLEHGAFDVGDVVLLREGLMEGRLLNADGTPIARAEITVRGVASDFGRLLPSGEAGVGPLYHLANRTTRTTADGTFRVAGLAAGNYEVYADIGGDSAEIDHGPYAVGDGEILVVPDLKVDLGLTIDGVVRVRGRPGLPAGARLLVSALGDGGPIRDAKVDADGSFRFERLKAGLHVLFAVDGIDGYAMMPRRDVPAGAKDVVIDLVPTETVEGRVVDHEDKPVVGAAVHFFPEGAPAVKNVFTDAAGRFRIEAPQGVRGNLGASDPVLMFRQAQQANVFAGTHDLVLKLPK